MSPPPAGCLKNAAAWPERVTPGGASQPEGRNLREAGLSPTTHTSRRMRQSGTVRTGTRVHFNDMQINVVEEIQKFINERRGERASPARVTNVPHDHQGGVFIVNGFSDHWRPARRLDQANTRAELALSILRTPVACKADSNNTALINGKCRVRRRVAQVLTGF